MSVAQKHNILSILLPKKYNLYFHTCKTTLRTVQVQYKVSRETLSEQFLRHSRNFMYIFPLGTVTELENAAFHSKGQNVYLEPRREARFIKLSFSCFPLTAGQITQNSFRRYFYG